MDHRLTASSPEPAHRAAWIPAILARFLSVVATGLGAGALLLTLLALAPGDAVDLLPNAEAVRPQLEAEWGLQGGPVERFGHYLGKLGRGDLGTSVAYRPGMPVAEVLAGPARRSLGLLGGALTLAIAGGTALAALTSTRPGTRLLSTAIRWISIGPLFLLAHLGVAGLNELAMTGMDLGWIRRPEWFALPSEPSTLRTALAITVLAVGSGTLTQVHQEVEAALKAIRRSGFVVAARARGAPLWPHILPNLVLPLATLATTRAVFLVGGLVILERVLLLHGAGAVFWQAALLRDQELALGAALLSALTVAAVRLGGDTLRIALDPRLRTGELR